jgi:hypothetical protein
MSSDVTSLSASACMTLQEAKATSETNALKAYELQVRRRTLTLMLLINLVIAIVLVVERGHCAFFVCVSMRVCALVCVWKRLYTCVRRCVL